MLPQRCGSNATADGGNPLKAYFVIPSGIELSGERQMAEPSTFEFGVLKVGDGASPEVFTTLCGIQTTGFSRAVQTNDRYVRDCAQPGLTPERRLRKTGKARTLTGSGLYNTAQTALLNTLEGARKNYQLVMMDISDEEAPEGEEIGTHEGPGMVTALNMGTSETDLATIEITVESDGAWTYTPAS
jgi:hypothetical protein